MDKEDLTMLEENERLEELMKLQMVGKKKFREQQIAFKNKLI